MIYVEHEGDALQQGRFEALGGLGIRTKMSIKTETEVNTARTAISDGNITAILALLGDMAADTKLTPTEKKALYLEWLKIETEKPIVIEQADAAGLDATFTQRYSYESAYTTLYGYLFTTPGIFIDMDTTSTIVPATFEDVFVDYFDARQDLLKQCQINQVGSLPPASSLIAHYSFDEMDEIAGTTNPIIDNSGNGNHLTQSGGITSAQGVAGRCGVFNGTNGWAGATIPSSEILSIACFGKVAGWESNAGILSSDKYNDPSTGMALCFTNDHQVTIYYGRGAGLGHTGFNYTVPTYALNTFYFWVLTYDKTDKKFRVYRDGTLIATTYAVPEAVMSGVTDICVGRLLPLIDNYYIAASIDEGYFFNTTLTIEQIRALYYIKSMPKAYKFSDWNVENAASDGIITPLEKVALLERWCKIYNDSAATSALSTGTADIADGEFEGIRNAANALGIWTPTTASTKAKAYYDAAEALRGYLFTTPAILLASTWYSPITVTAATYKALWAAYGKAYADLNAIISEIRAVSKNTVHSITEEWMGTNPLEEWDICTGSGELSLVDDSTCPAGGRVLKIGNNSGNDNIWLMSKKSIILDPAALYRVTFWMKRVSGSGTGYGGVAGRNGLDTAYVNSSGSDSYSSQYYTAASGVSPSSWTKYVGYIKGNTTADGAASPYPYDPGQFHASVKRFRALVVANYSAAAGEWYIGPIKIEEVTSTTALDEATLTSSGAFYSNDGKVKIYNGYIYTASYDMRGTVPTNATLVSIWQNQINVNVTTDGGANWTNKGHLGNTYGIVQQLITQVFASAPTATSGTIAIESVYGRLYTRIGSSWIYYNGDGLGW